MLKLRKLGKRLGRFGKRQTPVAARFAGVGPYWERRYAEGGTSGAGSAGRLAEFKADVLNRFVERNGIKTVLELGCGDGGQLGLARYPSYVGVDVAQMAVDLCRRRFADDVTKRFFLTTEEHGFCGSYDLVLSLDVIFHLVDNEVYRAHIADLKRFSSRYIIIYSSNHEDAAEKRSAPHVRHRCFSVDMQNADLTWKLIETIFNPYPYDPSDPINTSFSNFYIYERTEKAPHGLVDLKLQGGSAHEGGSEQ